MGDITTPPTPSSDAVACPAALNSAEKKKTQAQNAKNMKIPPQEWDGEYSKAPHSSGITANKERVYRKPQGAFLCLSGTPPEWRFLTDGQRYFVSVTQASDATSPEVTPKTSLASPPQSENIFSDTSIPTTQQNVNSGQAENSGSSEQRAKTNLGSKSTRAKTSQAVETLMEADITPEARQEQLNPHNTRPSPLVRVYATVSAMSREREQLPPSVLCTGL